MRCLKMLRALFRCWADEVSMGEKIIISHAFCWLPGKNAVVLAFMDLRMDPSKTKMVKVLLC